MGIQGIWTTVYMGFILGLSHRGKSDFCASVFDYHAKIIGICLDYDL